MSNADAQSESAKTAVARVAAIVSQLAGIQLGEKQLAMVESRLRSRMLRLRIENFDGYLRHLNANEATESQALLSLLTTHHTFFFREFNHFEYLLNHALTPLVERARARGDRKIRIWSAACSRGQEVYSLAMFFHFHLKATAPDIDFEIVGTDVDPDSVRWAANGVYRASELKQAPSMYFADHWVRGKNDVKDYFKVKESLRRHCRFEAVNLLRSDDFLREKSFDVIFCRNVFIYFDSAQIKQCGEAMRKALDPQGYIVLGVSESFNGLGLNLHGAAPAVYRHVQAPKVDVRPKTVAPKVPTRLLCVDDSPAILALLKKIFSSDREFEVVGTAPNGAAALELLKTLKVDAITLDLHMPEMDGLGFLANFKDKSVPVVVVSAINRDDTSIAQKAIALGAADYVEKPSLENIGQAANEIRGKVKSVLAMRAGTAKSVTSSARPVENRRKRVLIVDDSATIRSLLHKILSSDPELEVVGQAEKPSQVEELIRTTKPDVITLDIHMPEMNGVELLKRIHPKYKIPTVMITSASKDDGPDVLKALEIGAVDYIQKPEAGAMRDAATQIRDRVKVAANSQARRKPSTRRRAKNLNSPLEGALVVMGASTGGTEALREVLESLPSQIPPILIVQHIPAGFSAAFAKRLNELLPFEVKEAADGDEIRPNRVLIAPGGLQMGIASGSLLKVQIRSDAPVNRHQPSVDYLFRSVERRGLSNVIAVIMTGMGSDGADGLLALRRAGARTIAQDQKTCVVYGMPREAIERGAAEMVKPLDEIATSIVEIINGSASPGLRTGTG